MKRLVFLDFDGVVMTYESYIAYRSSGRTDLASPTWLRDHAVSHFDRPALARVSELCVSAQADIVLSTSWRGPGEEARAALESALWAAGLDQRVPVVGQTPNLWHGRGGEIGAWLDQHRPGWTRDRVLVLDDDPGITPFEDRWVRSSFSAGGFGAEQLAAGLALFGVGP